MSERERDLFEESIGAYVLGALDTAEEQVMRAHLEECESCRRIERRLRQASDLLPLAAQEVEPPPDLRGRILTAAGGSAAPVQRKQRSHNPVPIRRRWGTWGRPPMRLAAAALTLLVLAVGGLSWWNLSLQGQLHQADATVASRPIRPTSTALANADGTALVLGDRQLVVVSFKNMPQLSSGHVYELWLGDQGTFVPAGVFRPDADGSKTVVVKEGGSSYSVIALTVEPGPNGTSAPTQAPGMTGSL